MNPRARVLAVSFVLLLGIPLRAGAERWRDSQSHTPDVVYVGTPYDIVARMLQVARVRETDLVYDLGCGDGRMIVLAAKKFGCRGVGYDIDPERVSASRANVDKNQVARLVRIVEADLFTIDFKDADVLSLYLLPDINEKLVPQFEKLKPGSRLVFHNYGLKAFKADEVIRITSHEDNASHSIWLYTIPLKPQSEGPPQ